MIDSGRNRIDIAEEKTDRGEQAREALLQAAIEEFGARGLEGARIRAIASRAGQNVAAVSYYFRSKEGLYIAIAETMTARLRAQMAPLFAEADKLKQCGAVDDTECVAMICELLEGMMRLLLSERHLAPLMMTMMREQMQPTGAFDIYYEQMMKPLHGSIAHFLAKICGFAPDSPETVTRTHALIGQIVIFRVGQETLRRRANWTTIGEKERETAYAAIRASVRATLRGYLYEKELSNNE